MKWILILYSDERIFKIVLFYYVACYFTMIYRIHLTNLPHDLSVCKCHVSVCVTVSVYVVVVWQGPMEEQFLYWMDFTLYKYIWNKIK